MTDYAEIYARKLTDVRWQCKRREIHDRDFGKCYWCKDWVHDAHVHHNEYRFGLDPWDYSNDELTSLCPTCHAWVHSLSKAPGIIISWAQLVPDPWQYVPSVWLGHTLTRASSKHNVSWSYRIRQGEHGWIDAGCAALVVDKPNHFDARKWATWIHNEQRKVDYSGNALEDRIFP